MGSEKSVIINKLYFCIMVTIRLELNIKQSSFLHHLY